MDWDEEQGSESNTIVSFLLKGDEDQKGRMVDMDKWEHLAVDLAEEKDLLGSRLTAETLEVLHSNGLGWVVEIDGKIVACTFLFETPAEGWKELGSVWVALEHRNKKLAAKTFRVCITHAESVGLRAFLITKDPKVVHLSVSSGLVEATLATWKEVPWGASCGPCDRLAESEKPACMLRATSECRLFFMN